MFSFRARGTRSRCVRPRLRVAVRRSRDGCVTAMTRADVALALLGGGFVAAVRIVPGRARRCMSVAVAVRWSRDGRRRRLGSGGCTARGRRRSRFRRVFEGQDFAFEAGSVSDSLDAVRDFGGSPRRRPGVGISPRWPWLFDLHGSDSRRHALRFCWARAIVSRDRGTAARSRVRTERGALQTSRLLMSSLTGGDGERSRAGDAGCTGRARVGSKVHVVTGNLSAGSGVVTVLLERAGALAVTPLCSAPCRPRSDRFLSPLAQSDWRMQLEDPVYFLKGDLRPEKESKAPRVAAMNRLSMMQTCSLQTGATAHGLGIRYMVYGHL